MQTFFGYTAEIIHERRVKKQDKLVRQIHAHVCPEMEYAGIMRDPQLEMVHDLYLRRVFKYLNRQLRIGDCVCFIELERCFLDLEDLVEKANDLVAMGIRVILVDARIDSGTKEGQALLRSLYYAVSFPGRCRQLEEKLANIPIV